MRKIDELFSRARDWSSVITSTFSVVIGIVVVISIMVEGVTRFTNEAEGFSGEAAIQTLQGRVEVMDREITSLRSQLDSLSIVPDRSVTSLQLSRLEQALLEVGSRQSLLERAISDNPTRALEVPLLRMDLENLRTRQQESILAVRQDVNRVYDLNKWLLGAMAISIITLAVNNLLKAKDKRIEPDV